MSAPPFDVVIVAGGAGTRLVAPVPKAFVNLHGKPLFLYSIEAFDTHTATGSIILVVPRKMIELTQTLLAGRTSAKEIHIAEGGKERWNSVQNGVSACTADWIMVHDAARPFVTHAVIEAILEKTSHYDAVITATPETDTVRTFEKDRCLTTMDRTKLVRVGTPQLFRAETLKESFLAARSLDAPPTDEAMLMEKMGIPIGIAWGDPLNFKITTQADLTIAEALCARGR
jgi:2-C-methyl-D-erythritol 4-phosphate cytidylyltransferase